MKEITVNIDKYTVAAEIDELSGGYYAKAYVFIGTMHDTVWMTQKPASWGYRTMRDAMKARTSVKNQAIAWAKEQVSNNQ